MGKTWEDADASVVTMEDKSKNTKSEISDLQGVGGSDGNSYSETDCNLPKEKKGSKRSEKKKKTKLRSNEDEDRHYKGNLVNDGDISNKDKKKKRKRDSSEKTQTEENDNKQNDAAELSMEDSDSEKIDNKKQKLDAQNSDNVLNEIMTQESTPETQDDTDDSKSTKQKKKTNVKGTDSAESSKGKDKAKGKGKSKKVSFASHVEVFPSSDGEPKNQSTKGGGLIRGKRFTVAVHNFKEAVLNFMRTRELGDDGLKMVLNCRSHPGMKKCWKEIASCIPYRPTVVLTLVACLKRN